VVLRRYEVADEALQRLLGVLQVAAGDVEVVDDDRDAAAGVGGLLSSNTWKSSRVRLRASLPWASVTTTSSCTSSALISGTASCAGAGARAARSAARIVEAAGRMAEGYRYPRAITITARRAAPAAP
jgi:hypothetical protein